MKDEALKQVLEAITQYLAESPDPSEEAVEGLCDAASAARKALAQPEQPTPKWQGARFDSALHDQPPQPEQEPVAWMSDVGSVASAHEKKMGYVLESAFINPLYTTPPQKEQQEPVAVVTGVYGGRFTYAPFKSTVVLPVGAALYLQPSQRTWVGLTPQERDEINEQVYGAVPHHVAFHHAIEAKLRSKNG